MVNSSKLDLDVQGVFNDLEDILSETSDVMVYLDSSFSYGDFQLAGHGHKTNDNCGRVRSHYGCLHVESHDVIASDGKNHKGEVPIWVITFSCDKPSCPVCSKRGWAGREAHKIEVRLEEASKQFGEVEHLSVTFPLKFWHLTYEQLRAMTIKVLMARGVIGGVLIWHGARWDKVKCEWYWSPHFHVLGFILGGYGKCRGCKKKCFKGCGGFVDRNYRAFEKDGCIVRYLGKRKKSYEDVNKPNVGGTASYILDHATIKKSAKRFKVATWFGVCSYRKLKVTVERRKMLCFICGRDMVKVLFNGNPFIVDEMLASGKRKFLDVFIGADGRPRWIVDGEQRSKRF